MELKFASYNIHKAVGLDRRRDPERILAILREIDADVVALQETDRRFGAREAVLPRHAIAAHTPYQLVPVALHADSIGWHGNALLVRQGIMVTGASRVALHTLEPRGAVCAELRVGAQALRVAGMHLDLSGLHRRRQLRAVLAHMGRPFFNPPPSGEVAARRAEPAPAKAGEGGHIAKGLAKAPSGSLREPPPPVGKDFALDSKDNTFIAKPEQQAIPTVLMGDFNEWSARGGSLREFGHGWHVLAPGRSFPARRPLAQLDRIVISRGWEVVATGVHHSVLSARGSDHLPVFARLALPQL